MEQGTQVVWWLLLLGSLADDRLEGGEHVLLKAHEDKTDEIVVALELEGLANPVAENDFEGITDVAVFPLGADDAAGELGLVLRRRLLFLRQSGEDAVFRRGEGDTEIRHIVEIKADIVRVAGDAGILGYEDIVDDVGPNGGHRFDFFGCGETDGVDGGFVLHVEISEVIDLPGKGVHVGLVDGRDGGSLGNDRGFFFLFRHCCASFRDGPCFPRASGGVLSLLHRLEIHLPVPSMEDQALASPLYAGYNALGYIVRSKHSLQMLRSNDTSTIYIPWRYIARGKLSLGDTFMQKWERWDRLIDARKAKGLTQKEAATGLGIAYLTYNRWENGESYPDSIFKLQEISEFFGVSIDYLMYNDYFSGFGPMEKALLLNAAKLLQERLVIKAEDFQ